MKATEKTNELTFAVGKSALPVMEMLAKKLPNLGCAILCTADGLNICSLEISDAIVGKLSSLSSTLFSIGGSVIESILADKQQVKGDSKEVIIAIDNMQVMAVEVNHQELGSMVLLVAVEDTATGVLMMTLRYITEKLEEKFASPQNIA